MSNLRFGLCLYGQRDVHSHLVAVEVGVECGTNQRMQLNRASLYQNRLKRLNAQTVQRRCTVQQNRMSLDDRLRARPKPPGLHALHHLLRGLDVVRPSPPLPSCFMTNGLNSSIAISFGRPHWYIFSSGPTTMTRTAGVVDTLAEQVLTETSLLALQHVGQGLERTVVRGR